MKREIEFRAYCPIVNEYIPQDKVLINGTGEATFCGYKFKHNEQNSAKLKLEQFTGLTDKNGKKIYEGDVICYAEDSKCPMVYIVRFGSYNRHANFANIKHSFVGAGFYLEGIKSGVFKECKSPIIAELMCENGYGFIYTMDADFPGGFARYNEIWGISVVGNIHDNPELVKTNGV